MHRSHVKHDIRTLRSSAWAGIIVAMVAAAAMTNCFFGSATNLCERSGRRCSPGQTCAANQNTCIDINGCGDGIVSSDKGEVCDDGNTISGDGCSADCKSDESCGNGITDFGETCDDDNTKSGDGCSANCILETCGDGVYNPQNNEECDTGIDTQACNGNGKCTIPRCGDGYTNTEFTPFRALAKEQCDEGDPKTGEVADSATCNGNHDGLDGPGSCRPPVCGDNYLNKAFKPNPNGPNFEVCDAGENSLECNGNDDVVHRGDGSILQDNSKDSKCQVPRCGDGYVNPLFKPNPNGSNTEACDMGMNSPDCNGNDDVALGMGESFIQDDNKDSKCQIPRCGDGYVNPMFKPNPQGSKGEACDTSGDSENCNGSSAGDSSHHNSIDAQCQVAQCGDGYFNSSTVVPERSSGHSHNEQCDDGKNTSDCNANDDNPTGIGNCKKPSCGDGYKNPEFQPLPKFSWTRNTPGEECDNGNDNNDDHRDACRTDCRKAFCGDGVIDTGETCDKGDPKTPKPIPPTGCPASGPCSDDCKRCI